MNGTLSHALLETQPKGKAYVQLVLRLFLWQKQRLEPSNCTCHTCEVAQAWQACLAIKGDIQMENETSKHSTKLYITKMIFDCAFSFNIFLSPWSSWAWGWGGGIGSSLSCWSTGMTIRNRNCNQPLNHQIQSLAKKWVPGSLNAFTSSNPAIAPKYTQWTTDNWRCLGIRNAAKCNMLQRCRMLERCCCTCLASGNLQLTHCFDQSDTPS